MTSPSNIPSEIKLGLLYDLEKKEILLRFERGAYARAYQAKNPEGRILTDKPRWVWLPVSNTMRYLYSSDSWGLVIIFRSEDERRKWLQRSILGEEINTSEGEFGVRFKRYWNRNKFYERLDFKEQKEQGLGVPKERVEPHSRPGSSDGRRHAPPSPAFRPYVPPPIYESAVSKTRD